MGIIRICTKCGKHKFWYELRVDKSGIFGLRPNCKSCFREYRRVWEKTEVGRECKRRERKKAKKYERMKKKPSYITRKCRQRRRRMKRAVVELRDCYIKERLKRVYGIPKTSIPTELIELKRAQLSMQRELKKMNGRVTK